jgi:hypothetical protein
MADPTWTFQKQTSLSLAEAERIVFDIHEGNYTTEELPFMLRGKSACRIVRDGLRYTITFADGHKELIEADPQKHSLAVQGQWWYRGVYTFESDGTRTLITLKVYNVAKKLKWAASLMILPEKKEHQKNFERFVHDLEREANGSQ